MDRYHLHYRTPRPPADHHGRCGPTSGIARRCACHESSAARRADRAQSDAMVATYEAEWPALGFGSWTASERASDDWRPAGRAGRAACAHRRLRRGGTSGLRARGAGQGLWVRALPGPRWPLPSTSRSSIASSLSPGRTTGPSQRSLEKSGMVREREIRMESGRTILLYAAFSPNRNPRVQAGGLVADGPRRRRAAGAPPAGRKPGSAEAHCNPGSKQPQHELDGVTAMVRHVVWKPNADAPLPRHDPHLERRRALAESGCGTSTPSGPW